MINRVLKGLDREKKQIRKSGSTLLCFVPSANVSYSLRVMIGLVPFLVFSSNPQPLTFRIPSGLCTAATSSGKSPAPLVFAAV